MSYRSSLSIPDTSSGNVGATFSAVVGTLVLATGVSTVLTSIVVPAGTYSVNMCVNLFIANTTNVTSGFIFLGSAPAGSAAPATSIYSIDIIEGGIVATANISRQLSPSFTVTLTQPTILYLEVGVNFSVAGISSVVPTNVTVPYSIKAIKLA